MGANDEETITINLSEINASTLSLSSLSVTGPQDTNGDGTVNFVHQFGGITTAEMREAYGETTQVGNTTIAENAAGTLASRLGVDSGDVSFHGDALTDEAGNWYAQVNILADSTNVAALNAAGFDLEAGDFGTYYIALEPSEADVSTATTAAFTLDTANMSLSDLQSNRTANPLPAIDSALGMVDELRSDLGAIQNRFESTIANLQTNHTNLAAARSRIEDADYAEEVSNMTRAQILQQAGTSVLAQANQVPQNVLSLLG